MGLQGQWRKNWTIISLVTVVLLLLMGGATIRARAQNQLPDSPKPQNNAPEAIPDSPMPQNNAPQTGESSSRPEQPSSAPQANAPQANEPQNSAPPRSNAPGAKGQSTSDRAAEGINTPSGTDPGPAPQPEITTVPPGTTPPGENQGSRDQLFTYTKNVNFVTVPVMVKSDSGYLVNGLLPQDFSVMEDGKPQKITFFTSDPFPLSAAVVIDLSMPDVDVQKIRNTLPALTAAFGQFDEVAIYSYGNTVKKWQGFTPATKMDAQALRDLKVQHGRNSTVPVATGPMAQSGPVINGRNMDGTPVTPGQNTTSATRQSHVLNDAILTAALDLSKRDRTRRKVLFVVSDGKELGSTASYADVMKVLLSNEIGVYAVGVGGSAIPGYGRLQKIHIPGMGYGDILPKYASATGGDVFTEFNQSAIETAYGRVTEEARNQYTIGYVARATPSSAYRNIEVVVHRPGLKVYAKDGYYPVPPARH